MAVAKKTQDVQEEPEILMQDYVFHLTNGDTFTVTEPYDDKDFRRGQKSIPNLYEQADDDVMICLGNPTAGFVYTKWKDVVYIKTGRVRRVSESNAEKQTIRN